MNINPYEVKTKEDLIGFLISLRSDLKIHEKDWENPTLDMFLDKLVKVNGKLLRSSLN